MQEIYSKQNYLHRVPKLFLFKKDDNYIDDVDNIDANGKNANYEPFN